jgi:hypothetical protein
MQDAAVVLASLEDDGFVRLINAIQLVKESVQPEVLDRRSDPDRPCSVPTCSPAYRCCMCALPVAVTLLDLLREAKRRYLWSPLRGRRREPLLCWTCLGPMPLRREAGAWRSLQTLLLNGIEWERV